MKNDQAELDLEDVELRLRRLVDAMNEEVAAAELVRECEHQLKRARAHLDSTMRKRQELAFMERRRRGVEDEASDSGVIRKRK